MPLIDPVQAATWLALLVGAWNAGVLGARARHGDRMTRGAEAGLLVAAAMAVIAWASWVGVLLRDAPTLSDLIPVRVSTGYRLAAVWSTWQGSILSIAVSALAGAALASSVRRRELPGRVRRQAFVLSATGSLGLAVLVLDVLPPSAVGVPAFVQSPAAALAPLAALVAIVLLLLAASLAPCARQGAPPPAWRSLRSGAWIAATIALGAEQVARSRLGIGPRDPVVLGSATNALALWVFVSALVHRRVERMIWPASSEPARPPAPRWGLVLGHAGAMCVAASFAAHVFAARATLTIASGQSVQTVDAFGRTWTLASLGVSRYDVSRMDITALGLEATAPGGHKAIVRSELRDHYTTSGRVLRTGRRGSTGSPWIVFRVRLESIDQHDVATVRTSFVPGPVLWDAGVVLLLLSCLMVVLRRAPMTSFRST